MSQKYCKINRCYSAEQFRRAEVEANEDELDRVLAFKAEVQARLKAQEKAQKEEVQAK